MRERKIYINLEVNYHAIELYKLNELFNITQFKCSYFLWKEIWIHFKDMFGFRGNQLYTCVFLYSHDKF